MNWQRRWTFLRRPKQLQSSGLLLGCLSILLVIGVWALQGQAQTSIEQAAGASYTLLATPETTHLGYISPDLPPVLKVKSGDTVTFSTMPNAGEEARPGRSIEELVAAADKLRKERNLIGPHTLTGPVYIDSAEPGDVLEIKIKQVVPVGYAGQIIFPGERKIGLLPEEFPKGTITHLYVDSTGKSTKFDENVTLPVTPFMGIMAVAPPSNFSPTNPEAGRAWQVQPERIDTVNGVKRFSSVPPDLWGGNFDNKELAPGTSLFLQVFNKGALFSTSDGHLNQGNGEVGLTASEAAMKSATFQFIVHKNLKVTRPVAETPTHFITIGFDPDVDVAMKTATRDMIDLLVKSAKLDRLKAYSLVSLAMDLNIAEVVDVNREVYAKVPKSIFKRFTPIAQITGSVQTPMPTPSK